MPETILVVEYEPRYTERVRQALSGQPFIPSFARDGAEALRAIATGQPRLIVLSSAVPNATTVDLIQAVRSRPALQKTPILLTVSGYAGKSPEADAQRVGASDILPKPYTDAEFLGKVQQLLTPSANRSPLHPSGDVVVRSTPPAEPGNITSKDLFGDVLEEEEERTVITPPRKISKANADVDKMIADTLAGVMTPKKTTPGTPKPPTIPGTTPTPKPKSDAASALDKMVHDTLSGLEKKAKSTPPPAAPPVAAAAPSPEPVAAAQPAAPPAPAAVLAPPASAPIPSAAQTPTLETPPPADDNGFDKVVVSQPVIAPAPLPQVEEEEPVDGVKFGQYVLLEKIATGGMAEVWKARMRGVEGFQKTVAIKKILPHLSDNQDFVEMFVDEAKLAAQLNHNNIIHIYDLGKIASSYYIAMEYVDGWDLKTILKKAADRDQPMSVELALFVASKVASALDYAHRRRGFDEKELGLVHRDVSPQNVLISQEGDIKLCDFGIAKAASKASHTLNGALKGKLQYMSPEQAWGQPIDRRADVFSLATVLFELLTGRKLFTGDSELSILEQVREARVTPPSQWNEEVTPEMDRIVLKALQKDPAARYQTAGEMAREIDQILYSMKPTPTSADLAIFMHRISTPEPVVPTEPDLEETVIAPPAPPVPQPVAVVPPAPAAVAPKPAPAAAAASRTPTLTRAPFQEALEPEKKSRVVPIAIAAIVVIAAGVGGFMMLRKPTSPAASPQPAPVAAATAAPQPSSSTAAVPPATITSTASLGTTDTTASAASTAPAVDPTRVEEEVRRRLESERQRLEQLARTQQQPQPAPRPAQPQPRVTPPQNLTPPQSAAAQPRPAVTQTQPPPPQVTAPVQTATTATAAPEPATASAAPAEPRAKEGDLVSSPDTAPHVTARTTPQYPPLARTQHFEGVVIVSVLVSETGKVLDVRLLSGLPRGGLGINDSAMQTVRRWTFAPATKDGVRVKSWTTVRMEFKL